MADKLTREDVLANEVDITPLRQTVVDEHASSLAQARKLVKLLLEACPHSPIPGEPSMLLRRECDKCWDELKAVLK